MRKKKPQQLSWLDLDKIEVTDNPRILALLGISKLDDKIKPFRAQRKNEYWMEWRDSTVGSMFE